MLFKLGLKNLKNNLLMNILIILQMTVVFIILISMISTVVSRFEYYIPLKTLLNSNGYFYNVTYGLNPETKETIRTTDELYNMLDGADKIIAEYSPWFDYKDENGEYQGGKFISYDDDYINLFTPILESGSWIDTGRDVQNIVQVIVSQNNYGIKTGDIISLFCFDYEIKAEVTGILEADTRIIDPSGQIYDKIDYRDIYTDYNSELEGKPIFIFRQEELNDKMVNIQLNGNLFVEYPENASEELIEENNKQINRMHTLFSCSSAEMKEHSLDYIFSQIYNLMPICICILILTLVGAISTSALSAKQQLKNYAIYYICGLEWKHCAYINLFSSLICVMISFFISIITIFAARLSGIAGNTVIEFGIWQLVGCIAVILLYVLLSVILPVSITKNSTPAKVLKTN